MCGIFVVLERSGPIDPQRLREGVDALAHRGPDAQGTTILTRTLPTPRGEATVHLGFGHTRLSILDLDARSDQPFVQPEGALVHNGEVYNYEALRRDLFGGSEGFRTTGDTEVLFRLLLERGHDALPLLNGMWAFAFFDERRHVLLASRDRYGKKPLFYYADDTTLCLSSSAATILRYLGRAPEMDRAALAHYLRHGFLYPDPGGRTHLRDIRQVPGSHSLSFDLATWQATTRRYYDARAALASQADGAPPLEALLADAVCSRLVSDRRVGLLLSGGIDSSLILSILVAQGRHEQVHCFLGDTGTSDDARYARECTAQLGIRATEIRLAYGASTFERFLRMCRHQEKPFPLIGNSMAMAEMYEAIAAYDVPVVLDGTGGDEVFGGYWDRYLRVAIHEAGAAGDGEWLARLVEEQRDDPLVSQYIAWARAEMANPSLPPPSLDTPFAAARFCSPDVLAAPLADPLPAFRGTLAEALVTDAMDGRLGEWIWHNDRNAMMSSIENRSPFLDYRLVPFMASGYRAKFAGTWSKHELRRAYDAFVALPTQWRREKQGFRWVGGWFLRENAAPVLELVAGSRVLRELVEVDAFVDHAAKDGQWLAGELAPRLACIAGLEATTGLALAAN